MQTQHPATTGLRQTQQSTARPQQAQLSTPKPALSTPQPRPTLQPASAQHPNSSGSLFATLAVLYGAGFLAGFNENLMNMTLVAVMGQFGIDAVTAQWLVTGYMIAVTVAVACTAYLYGRFTLRQLFFSASALSIAGSLGGLLAPGFFLLLLSRIVQAAGTGLLIPLMMNVIVERLPKEKLGTYLAIGSSMITVGPAVAPVITGFMVTGFGWRSVFFIPLGVAILLLVTGVLILRNGREGRRSPFDGFSVVLIAAGVTLLCLGLADVTTTPWLGMLLLVLSVALLGWFVVRQKRSAHPLISMTPFSNGRFRTAAALVMVTMMTYFSLSVLAPLYFEEGGGVDASMAGLLMLPPVLANALAAVVAGRVLDRKGQWPLLAAGLGIAAIGLGIAIAGAQTGHLAIAVSGVFFGYLGCGLVLSPAQTSGLHDLSEEQNSHGVTLMSLVLQLAACLGPAAYVGVMSAGSSWASTSGASAAVASATGFSWALLAALVVVAAGIILALARTRTP